jgi:hypothetical protein
LNCTLAKFNLSWEEKENLTLKDVKILAPLLFVQLTDSVTLERIIILTEASGTEWNDSLTGIFEANKTSIMVDEVSLDVIEFATWKSLLPIVFETADEREIRLAVEWQAILAKKSEGQIIINYQMYNEEFPVSKNSITSERIDEDYGLTDVMPGCRLRLSTLDPQKRTLYENTQGREAPWAKEEPEGTFQELLAGGKYYCVVIENPEQYKKDMVDQAKKMEKNDNDTEAKPRQEGCSCLYGNPCQDKYICLDWENRWAVAIANGMNQAEIKRAGVV